MSGGRSLLLSAAGSLAYVFRKAVPNMPLACWVLGCSAASSVGSYAQTPRFIAKFEGNALPQARATEVQHPAGTAQGVAAAGVPASVKDTDAASMHTHVDQVCVYYTPKHSLLPAGSLYKPTANLLRHPWQIVPQVVA